MEQIKDKTEGKDLNNDFADFTGTCYHHKHWLPGMVYTDGIRSMAEKYKAYWLLDVVFSYWTHKKVRKEPFQIWTITAKDGEAVVKMQTDTDKPIMVKQDIPFTDFPEGTLKMYLSDRVLLLPSEY